MRVRAEIFDSRRIRRPIVSPTVSPSVAAMRLAAARAARRRGSSKMSLRPFAQSASSIASGARVVLPAPGGATTTRLHDASSAARIAGSTSSIGNAERSCSIGGARFKSSKFYSATHIADVGQRVKTLRRAGSPMKKAPPLREGQKIAANGELTPPAESPRASTPAVRRPPVGGKSMPRTSPLDPANRARACRWRDPRSRH